MLKKIFITCFYLCLVSFSYAKPSDTRIVSIGSSITEWIIALGSEKSIVGIDLTGNYSPAIEHLPKVGYQRTLNAEGIASLKPTLVIGSQEMGPESTLKQLTQLGIKVEVLTTDTNLQTLSNNLITLGKLLNKETQATELFNSYQQKLIKTKNLVAQVKKDQQPPTVLVVIGPHGNMLSAGKNTTADWLIEQAGGVNAVDFNGYKVLSNEAFVALNPDIIIIADQASVHLNQAIASLTNKTPSLKVSKALKNNKIIMLDATLLVAGLGPRLPDEAVSLAKVFYTLPKDGK